MEGLNEHLRQQYNMAGGSGGSGGSNDPGRDIPVTGDIGISQGVKIERVS